MNDVNNSNNLKTFIYLAEDQETSSQCYVENKDGIKDIPIETRMKENTMKWNFKTESSLSFIPKSKSKDILS